MMESAKQKSGFMQISTALAVCAIFLIVMTAIVPLIAILLEGNSDYFNEQWDKLSASSDKRKNLLDIYAWSFWRVYGIGEEPSSYTFYRLTKLIRENVTPVTTTLGQ